MIDPKFSRELLNNSNYKFCLFYESVGCSCSWWVGSLITININKRKIQSNCFCSSSQWWKKSSLKGTTVSIYDFNLWLYGLLFKPALCDLRQVSNSFCASFTSIFLITLWGEMLKIQALESKHLVLFAVRDVHIPGLKGCRLKEDLKKKKSLRPHKNPWISY